MIEVTCAIIIEKEQILVTQRSESMPHPLKWEFPGGKLKEGESAENCIKREIREELGLEIRVDQLLRATVYSYDTHTIKLIPFRCTIVNGSVSPAEHRSFRWVPIKELAELDWLEADVEVVRQLGDIKI